MPLVSLHKIPAAIILTLLLFGNLAAEENFPFIGIVKENGINIRSDSTVSSAIIGHARQGQEVTVIHQAYDWYKIRFENNFAWIHKKFVERKPQVPEVLVTEVQETEEPQGALAADE
ncbi:MAG: SH3 domain-containing protein, partial [Candidatus Omnitrophota bacterium]|nr:SH3 domain-containing protein [Candidatus Omnitrophota bacterium]